MKWLRKTTAAVILGVTLVTSVALTPQVHAHPPGQAQHHIYYVYYRSSPHVGWVCYGGYYQASQAQQAVTWFRYQHYDAFYR